MIESTESFGKYTLVQRLAVGGMAEIYKAKTQGVDGFEKLLAIKRLHRRLCEDQDFTMMLVDEAKISVQLNHANIGQVFDLGYIDEQYFIVMEYIDGVDMHQVLRKLRKAGQRIPLDAALYIICQACEALHYAHTKFGSDGRPLEIVHRDVSPQNVMVSNEGEVKLVDFGIAKARMRAQQTQAGIIKGKFYYMSPEQAHGHRVDARTDVYAVGILLYEMLAGKNPYEGVDDAELLKCVRMADFSPITAEADVDAELGQIIQRALQRNPELRFQSALEMHRALQFYAHKHLRPFSRIELADFLAEVSDISHGRSGEHPNYRPMQKQEYSANESSMIFDAGALAAGAGEEEDERTRVFDRANLSEEGDAVERPVPISNAFLDQPHSASFLDETREAPYLRSEYAPSSQGSANRQPSPLPDITSGGNNASLLASSVHVKPRTLGLVGAGVLIFFGILLFALSMFKAAPSSIDPSGLSDPAIAQLSQGPVKTTNLAVSSAPANAQLYVDEVLRGDTPFELTDLDVGRAYTLSFRRSGYAEATVQVVVEAHIEPLVVKLEPLQGVLKITTYPAGAQITLNAEVIGLSPVTAMGVARDIPHKVIAELDGQSPIERTIAWGEDDERIKEIQLEFDGLPTPVADAQGVVDLVEVRPVPVQETKSAAVAKAPPRPQPKRESTPRAPKTNKNVQLGPSTSKPLNIWDLDSKDAATGTLSVRVTEGDGRVFVNGKPLEKSTPLVNHKLKPGSYDVRVYFPNFKRDSDTKKVRVEANKNASVVFSP
ncbi:MAG: serine/threonine protein kinase [Bradymonadaceae bacterium]|nr:serine/threonine protein kinase [Lujinxingiaceae bacterium]